MKYLTTSLVLLIQLFIHAQTIGAGVTDIDGNNYPTVIIGNQEWMAENLRTSMYQNGDAIQYISDANQWYNSTTGAYCWYDNNSSLNYLYGKYYNWYSVDDQRNICPVGWRIPSEQDFIQLAYIIDPLTANDMYTTGSSAAGSLKQVGELENSTGLWKSPNTAAIDSTGFTALPGGTSNVTGYALNEEAKFWSSTASTGGFSLNIILDYNDESMYLTGAYQYTGLNVRCMKDAPSTSIQEIKLIEKALIYPNPTNGEVTVLSKFIIENATIELLTVDGKILRSIKLENSGNSHFIIDEPKGIYFIKIKSAEQENQLIKIVKN